MAKVTYHAPEGDSEVVSLMGLRFFDGEPRELDDAAHAPLLAKLAHNPHFEVDGPPAAGSAPAGLRAIHRGFGRYSIVRGDEDEEIRDGLSKAEAAAFNALSEAEKQAFVG